MNVKPNVKLSIQLLIAEHGRAQLIAALAEVEKASFADVEQELNRYVSSKAKSKSKPPKTLVELLKDSPLKSPKLELVEQLGISYENKTFLPELWRVKLFLKQHGVKADTLRSRKLALAKLIEVLSAMTIEELKAQVEILETPQRGEMMILADHILKPIRERQEKEASSK